MKMENELLKSIESLEGIVNTQYFKDLIRKDRKTMFEKGHKKGFEMGQKYPHTKNT